MFTRALAERLPASKGVTPVAVHPGLCATEFGRHLGLSHLTACAINSISLSSEEGSRQLVYGALGKRDDEEGIRGQFVMNSEVIAPSKFVLGEDGKRLQERYWVRQNRLSRQVLEMLMLEPG